MAATGVVLIGKGASDLTRAEDERLMADRMCVLSQVVGAAGITDIEKGVEMLAASEDVNVVSALMGLMSLDDIEHGLELARLSGEMQTAGELVEAIRMPVLAGFLTKRSARLHEMSMEQIRNAVSTKAVSQVLSAAGKKIEALGENEMDEGVTRLAVSAVAKEESAAMSKASGELAVQGFEEVVVSAEVGRLARVQAMEGAAEISDGSTAVGAALAMEEVATSLKKKSEK
jgi:enoyl reductase-like protein